MSLVLRQNTPTKLVLSSPSKSEKSVVEKSLSSVIDTFDPEARKRLVASLRRREHEHKKDIENLQEQNLQVTQQAVRKVEEELLKAEKRHEHVLEQFERYKENLIDDQARLKLVKENEKIQQEEEMKKKLLKQEEILNERLEMAKEQYQEALDMRIKEMDQLRSDHEKELEIMKGEYEKKHTQMDADWSNQLSLKLQECITSTCEQCNKEHIIEIKQMEDKFQIIQKESIENALMLNNQKHAISCENKLTELKQRLKKEFENEINVMISFEKEKQLRLIEDEKKKTEETIHQISTVSASKIADFNHQVEKAVELRTEILEKRMKQLEEAKTKSYLRENEMISLKNPEGGIFNIYFVMLFIAIMCTWFGAVLAINYQ